MSEYNDPEWRGFGLSAVKVEGMSTGVKRRITELPAIEERGWYMVRLSVNEARDLAESGHEFMDIAMPDTGRW